MARRWQAFCHAVVGRGHERGATPCQDKTYPTQNATFSLEEGDVGVVVLADGAGSAKFSHWGAEKTTQVVARVLQEKFEVYFSMDKPGEVKEDILNHVLDALDELAQTKTQELRQDRFDLDSLLQEMLKELQSLQAWQKDFSLPLVRDLENAQEALDRRYHKTEQAQQPALKKAIKGVYGGLDNLKRYGKDFNYAVDLKSVHDRLERFHKDIQNMDVKAPFSKKDLEEELERISKKYTKLQSMISGYTHIKNKRGFCEKVKRFVIYIFIASPNVQDIQDVRTFITNSTSSLPTLAMLSIPMATLKDYHKIQADIARHSKSLTNLYRGSLDHFNTLLESLHQRINKKIRLKSWSMDDLIGLHEAIRAISDKIKERCAQMIRHQDAFDQSIKNYKSQLLQEIKQSNQEYRTLTDWFEEIQTASQRLLDDLSCASASIDTSIIPDTNTTHKALQVLDKIEEGNLEGIFKEFSKQVEASKALDRRLKTLRAHLGLGAPASSQPKSKVPRAYQLNRSHRDTEHSQPTPQSLLPPLPTDLLGHIQTLKTIRQELLSLKQQQTKLEEFQKKANALDTALKTPLTNLATQSQALSEKLLKSCDDLKDLQTLKTTALEKCVEDARKKLEQGATLVREVGSFHKDFAFNTCPPLHFSIIQKLQTFQECLQNKTCEVKDLASTLLAVAVHQDCYLYLHLGDGEIGILRDKDLTRLERTDGGEFSNETTFVTSQDAIACMTMGKGRLSANNIAGFVLMSDGSAEALYDVGEKRFVGLLRRYMNVARVSGIQEKMQNKIQELLDKRVKEKTFDDCSIAMLVRQDMEPASLDEKERDLYERLQGNS